MNSHRYINDEWTLDLETLGFNQLAVEVASKAIHCQPPFAQCVVGRWGSGKTSVMRYAMTLLGGHPTQVQVTSKTEQAPDPHELQDIPSKQIRDIWRQGHPLLNQANFTSVNTSKRVKATWPQIKTVWFSPWRFQQDDNPLVPFLHVLREHFEWWTRAKGKMSKEVHMLMTAGIDQLARLADGAAKAAWGVKLGLSKAPKELREARTQYEAETFELLTDTERFNLAFEKTVQTLLQQLGRFNEDDKKKGKSDPKDLPTQHRLVIFIDDLDRIEGERIVRFLEAIKLCLSTKNCVFVFGLDMPAVEQAVSDHWEKRPRSLAREYLDKMFQSYVYMPVKGHYDQLIADHLAQWNVYRTPSDQDQPADDKPADKTATSIVVNTPQEVATAIAEVLPANPRKVKNFLNSLRLELAHGWTETTDPQFSPNELWKRALVHRFRMVAPATFTLACGRESAYDAFKVFAKTASTGESLKPSDNHHQTTVFLHDFGHLVAGPGNKDAKVDTNELLIRSDRIRSGHAFCRRWVELQLEHEDLDAMTKLPPTTPPEKTS